MEVRNEKTGIHFVHPIIAKRSDVKGEIRVPIWPPGAGPYPLSKESSPKPDRMRRIK